MSDTALDTTTTLTRRREPPELHIDAKGRARLKGGRWNMQRVAEFLQHNPSWQTVDDLARFVYSVTGKTHRENVRKHIPPQRRYMLNQLEAPIVTQYGERGKIMRVKLYDKIDETDRMLLRMELDRARERKELTEHRYDSLLRVFQLPAPSAAEEENWA